MILNIANILPSSSAASAPATAPSGDHRLAETQPTGGDYEVDFSAESIALADAAAASSLRLARHEAIRAEIAAGTYLSPQRLEATIDRLLDVLG
jgi:hypothetical protein